MEIAYCLMNNGGKSWEVYLNTRLLLFLKTRKINLCTATVFFKHPVDGIAEASMLPNFSSAYDGLATVSAGRWAGIHMSDAQLCQQAGVGAALIIIGITPFPFKISEHIEHDRSASALACCNWLSNITVMSTTLINSFLRSLSLNRAESCHPRGLPCGYTLMFIRPLPMALTVYSRGRRITVFS